MNESLATPEAPVPPPAQVPLAQFTLRQLLYFVVGVSIILMIFVSLRGYAAIAFGIGVVLVAGHVLSTMIGSRLRAGADAVREWELQQSGRNQIPDKPRLPSCERPQASQLQVRTTCSRVLWGFVGIASAVGAFLGAAALKLLAGEDLSWPGQLIGAFSVGLVFGWAALILAGICGIARRSWREVEDRSKSSRSS